jgi:N-carbamoylputrescine amidase
VALPELFNTGYQEDSQLHRAAEDWSGPTVSGLRELSCRYDIYVAGGFVERHEGDVYDSLAFCTPAGAVSLYRKRHLIFWEHYYFRAGRQPLVVETALGRVGFAICADMLYRHVWSEYRGRIDLAIVSAAWPRECAGATRRVGWLLRPSWKMAQEIPLQVARELRIPVVFSNQWGPCRVRVPLMGPASIAQFAGRSGIYDGVAGKVSDEVSGEGLAIGSVTAREEEQPCATLSA